MATLLRRWALVPLLYAVVWLLVRVLEGPLGLRTLPQVAPAQDIPSRTWFCLSFLLFFAPILYGAMSLLAGQWLRPSWRVLVFHAGTTFLCAVLAELGVDRLYELALGRPCWTYHLWPLHLGHTSGVGVVMWPLYGAFVCLLHMALRLNPRLAWLNTHLAKGVLVAVDAMVLEVAANAFAIVTQGRWLFFYLQPDLLHFTTAEIFLPYVVAGVAGVGLLHFLESRVPHVWAGLLFYAVGAGVLFAG